MWRLALVSVPVTLIFIAAQAVVLAGTRLAYPGEYVDPFTPYEAVMPGQLATYWDDLCERQTTEHPYVRIVLCEIQPDSGPFVSVSSNIFEGRFVRTSFSAHDLSLGDVVRHWGRPDVVVQFNYRSYYVLWTNQGLVGFIDPVGPIGRFSYLLPVEYFTIGLRQPNSVP